MRIDGFVVKPELNGSVGVVCGCFPAIDAYFVRFPNNLPFADGFPTFSLWNRHEGMLFPSIYLTPVDW